MSINVPEGIIGIAGGEVYINGNHATGQCEQAFSLDSGMSILNLLETTQGIQIRCGHIMEDGNCRYLSHVQGENVECSLHNNQEVKVISSEASKKEAA